VFRFTRPEPVLRALLDPKAVSALLVNAIAAVAEPNVRIERAGERGDAPAETMTAAQPVVA